MYLTNSVKCGIIYTAKVIGCFSLSTYISPSKQPVTLASNGTNWWADIFIGDRGMQAWNVSGIYEIRNVVTNHNYIGSSVNLSGRWSHHKTLLRSNSHGNSHLQRAWNKYGETSFEFNALVLCPVNSIHRIEQILIDEENPYYNIATQVDAKNNTLFAGHKHTDESRKIMSLKSRGENAGNGKLSELDVIKIRRLYYLVGLECKGIAEKFGVCLQNVSSITSNTTWKHIPWEFPIDIAQKYRRLLYERGRDARLHDNRPTKYYPKSEESLRLFGLKFRGEGNPRSKVTEADVIAIRKEYAEGNISQRLLGLKYGVGRGLISGIVSGKNWRYLL